jgi:hypothetical protein
MVPIVFSGLVYLGGKSSLELRVVEIGGKVFIQVHSAPILEFTCAADTGGLTV